MIRQNAVLRDGKIRGSGRSIELLFLRIEVNATDELLTHCVSFSMISQRPIAESDGRSSAHRHELSDLSSPEEAPEFIDLLLDDLELKDLRAQNLLDLLRVFLLQFQGVVLLVQGERRAVRVLQILMVIFVITIEVFL